MKVTEAEPEYADGWVNVARARIQEGNLARRAEHAAEGARARPGLARRTSSWASALKARRPTTMGRSTLAGAAAQYPRDRVVLNQLGRVLFLKRRSRRGVER